MSTCCYRRQIPHHTKSIIPRPLAIPGIPDAADALPTTPHFPFILAAKCPHHQHLHRHLAAAVANEAKNAMIVGAMPNHRAVEITSREVATATATAKSTKGDEVERWRDVKRRARRRLAVVL